MMQMDNSKQNSVKVLINTLSLDRKGGVSTLYATPRSHFSDVSARPACQREPQLLVPGRERVDT